MREGINQHITRFFQDVVAGANALETAQQQAAEVQREISDARAQLNAVQCKIEDHKAQADSASTKIAGLNEPDRETPCRAGAGRE